MSTSSSDSAYLCHCKNGDPVNHGPLAFYDRHVVLHDLFCSGSRRSFPSRQSLRQWRSTTGNGIVPSAELPQRPRVQGGIQASEHVSSSKGWPKEGRVVMQCRHYEKSSSGLVGHLLHPQGSQCVHSDAWSRQRAAH